MQLKNLYGLWHNMKKALGNSGYIGADKSLSSEGIIVPGKTYNEVFEISDDFTKISGITSENCVLTAKQKYSQIKKNEVVQPKTMSSTSIENTNVLLSSSNLFQDSGTFVNVLRR